MELKKRSYKRSEVNLMLEAYKTEYESRINEQRNRIQELISQNDSLCVECEKLKQKENLILLTLERAEKTALELKELSEKEYALEIERLKKFSEKWDAYFKKVKEKYPTSSAVKKAVGIKSKLDKSIKLSTPKEVIDEMENLIDGKSKTKFQPKNKIRDYIAATENDGFNMEEVLNPGDLQLEDLCKELGLLEEND